MSTSADYQYDDPFLLQASLLDAEDIRQEAELLKLQGITPNRRIIRMKMAQHNNEVLFQGDPGILASPVATTSVPPAAVVELLVSWAIQQSDEITTSILKFLEEPNEDGLTSVIRQLKKAGLTAPEPEKHTRGTLSEALTAFLGRGEPRTREELYAYARSVHTSERPEAAVRQFLRRGLKNRSLIQQGDTFVSAQIGA